MRARKRVQRHFGEEGDGDVSVARAKGSYLFDTRGKRYVDFVMGWCVGSFGGAIRTSSDASNASVGPITFIRSTATAHERLYFSPAAASASMLGV